MLRTSRTLIATIKDFGACPCPRCLVLINEIYALGRADDRKRREELHRQDNVERREKVDAARESLYNEGYAITGDHVDGVLKDESLVPTRVFASVLSHLHNVTLFVQNAFSVVLSPFGFDFHKMLTVDVLHEVELGVWKALFTHLVRMLHACGADKVYEFDRRYAPLDTELE